jgi:gliding motility-associated-like protein
MELRVILLLILVAFSFSRMEAQAPGDDCGSAVTFTLPTIIGNSTSTGVQSTLALTDDYPSGTYCTSSLYGDGNDGVYEITVTTAGDYTFEYKSSGMSYKVLSIHSGCPITSGNCVDGFVTSGSSGGSDSYSLTPGTYYLVVDNWPAPAGGDFELEVTLDSQVDPSVICDDANGFCSDVVYDFPNTTVGTPPTGPDYSMTSSCVSNSKPIVFYYMEVQTAGPMELTLSQSTGSNGTGGGIDVDFVMWGPYSDLTTACTGVMVGDNPAQGSFSASATETIYIGGTGGYGDCASTLATPSVGDVYMIGISNYGNTSGYISFSQNSGSGGANCNTITPCNTSLVTASAGACSGGTFDITGDVTFTDAPATGTMTVTSSFGESTDYSAPFTSPLSYTISGESGSGSGTVSVAFSDDAFCTATSSSITAPTCVVCTAPSIDSESLLTQSVCEGGSPAALSIAASGTNITYQWYSDTDNDASGGTSLGASAQTNSYTPSAASAGTTYYYVVVTGDCGTATSSASDAIIINGLPTATVSPDPAEVCEGTTLALDGNPAGGSGTYTTHSWTGDISHLDNSSIQAPMVQATATATTYNMTYTVTDDNGCQGSDAIAVVVNGLPIATVSPDPAEVCEGTTLALDGNPAGGSGTYTTHAWSGDVIHLDNTAIQAPMVQATATATTYNMTYTVTDDNGCQGSDAIAVVVNGGLNVDAGSDVNICDGDLVTFNGSGADSYLWVNGAVGIIDGVSWDHTSIGLPVGSYLVDVEGTDANGCSGTDDLILTINPNPNANAGEDLALNCNTPDLMLNGSNSDFVNVTYSWTTLDGNVSSGASSVNGYADQAGTYTLTVTNELTGCSSSDDMQVTGDLDTLDITTSTIPSLCNSDAIIDLGSYVSSVGGINESWSGNGIIDMSSGEFHPGFGAGTYTITYQVQNPSNNCVSTKLVTVQVGSTPTVGINGSTLVCDGNTVSLTGTGAYTYFWSDGNSGETITADLSTGTNTIDVTGTSSDGCSSTAQIIVENASPNLELDGLDSTLLFPYNADLMVTGEDVDKYIWIMTRDNGMVDTLSQTDVFEGTIGQGYYDVVVIGENLASGCIDSLNFVLDLMNPDVDELNVPNIITPNGDGKNDYLKFNLTFTDVDFKVYNRWGILIYQSIATKAGWDGRTITGEEASSGVYFYIIKGTFLNGEMYELHNSINLIR